MRWVWRVLFVQSWWVWCFALVCYGAFDLASSRQVRRHAKLEQRVQEKQRQLALASAEGEDLQRQLQSQSDPAWIELVLMRELGMVPKGQQKVLFE